jgi:hypothetical protein
MGGSTGTDAYGMDAMVSLSNAGAMPEPAITATEISDGHWRAITSAASRSAAPSYDRGRIRLLIVVQFSSAFYRKEFFHER